MKLQKKHKSKTAKRSHKYLHHLISSPKSGIRHIFIMRPIANSSSCNTLIDLNLDNYKNIGADSSHVHDIEFLKSDLFLPRDQFAGDLEGESDLCLVDIEEGDNHLYLPSSATGTSHVPVDVYLRGIPEIIENADNVLAQSPRVFKCDEKGRFSNFSEQRVLNVLQGEMAHAVPEQCDIMISDDATTCHIVALRSYKSMNNACSNAFVSLTHIDDPQYETSIRGMFLAHQEHHKKRQTKEGVKIDLDVHIMGGFDDQDGTSREISEYLISLFSTIATELRDFFKITIQTCAITSINDNGACSPTGRGFGIEISTGDVFLAEVDQSMVGPVVELRCAQGWTIDDVSKKPSLRLIHDADNCKARITIQPFKFEPFQDMDLLLKLPDDLMLHHTSTSPTVEKDNYCDNMRRNLRFILSEKWWDYFGPNCDKPVVFERVENKLNEWKRL